MKAKLFALACLVAPAAFGAVSETPEEFHGSADVNGDGRPDIVVVDKLTGIYRLAYGQASGTNLWVDGRPSGVENVSGFAAGRVLNLTRDALLFTSPAANRINVFDASAVGQAGQPVNVFIDSIGPNRVAALDIGGSGNTTHDDIYTPSADNTASEPYRLSLTRSTGAAFSKVWDTNVTATVVTVGAVRLKTNVVNPILAGAIQRTGTNYSFVAQNLSTGVPVNSSIIPNLPPADAYVYANFDGTALNQFLFYRAGSSNLLLRPVIEIVPGFFQFGSGATFAFNKSLREVLTIPGLADIRLLIIFAGGETAGVYSFNGVTAPVLVESFAAAPGESFTGAAA
ncbi:MAG TPA: hypothetical protein VJS65_14885, partial [Verrucomicrobiae bacterium]|nr:hypothetical protein [Verrucomicrobiae bacterium]